MPRHKEGPVSNSGDFDSERQKTTIFFSGVSQMMTYDNLTKFIERVVHPERISFKEGSNFAHADFTSSREAEQAIALLNDAPPYNLQVKMARPRTTNPQSFRSQPVARDREVVSPPPTPVSSVSQGNEEIPPSPPQPELEGACKNCLAVTSSICKDCKTFFCSIECMMDMAEIHMSYCNKLTDLKKRETGGRKSVFNPPQNNLPRQLIGFENSRFRCDSMVDKDKIPWTRFKDGPVSSMAEQDLVTSDSALRSSRQSLLHEERNDHRRSFGERSTHMGESSMDNFDRGHSGRSSTNFNEGKPKAPFTERKGFDSHNIRGPSKSNETAGFKKTSSQDDNWGDEPNQSDYKKFNRGTGDKDDRKGNHPNIDRSDRNNRNDGNSKFVRKDSNKFDRGASRSKHINGSESEKKTLQNDFGKSKLPLKENTMRNSLQEQQKEIQPPIKPYGDRQNSYQRRNEKDTSAVTENSFPTGVDIEVVLLWTDEDGYWVLPVNMNQKWQEFTTHLTVASANLRPLEPRLHELCCAKFEKEWYRARVVSLEPLTVHYIDYGNKAICEKSDLRELPQKYCDTPPLVKSVKLIDSKRQLINDSNYTIRVLKNENNVDYIEIVEPKKNGLPEKKLAQKDDKPQIEKPQKQNESQVPKGERIEGITGERSKTEPSAGIIKSVTKVSAKEESRAVKPSVPDLPYTCFVDTCNVGDSGSFEVLHKIDDGRLVVLQPKAFNWKPIHYLNCNNVKAIVAGKNRLVAVKCPIDDLALCGWARGCLISIQIGLYKVALIDYGLVVAVEEIFPLPDSLTSLPAMACVLHITDKEKKFPSDCGGYRVEKRQEGGWLCEINDEGRVNITRGVLSGWNPFLDANLAEGNFKSGAQVTIPSYRGISRVFITSVDEQFVEKYTQVFGRVAHIAEKAQPLTNLPSEGTIVAAKFLDDGAFYRAKVIGLVDNKAQLLFIDFGNSQVSPVGDLRMLPKELCDYSPAARLVLLRGVPDVTCAEASALIATAVANQTIFDLTYGPDLSDGVILTESSKKTVLNDLLNSAAAEKPEAEKQDIVTEEDELKSIQLKVGPAVEILVTAADPNELRENGKLYCTMSEKESELTSYVYDELTKKLNEHCSKLPHEPYRPRSLEVCAALFLNEWARAFCLGDAGPSSVLCFFMDYGNTDVINTSDIRKVSTQFKETPGIAVECYIQGMEEASGSKKGEIATLVEKELMNQIHTVEVSQRDEYSYFLHFPKILSMLG